jgi:ubiquinone biosynthesis protein Coq4
MKSTNSDGYAYSAEPVRNPLRYALAVWRLIRSDPSEATEEAAIVEMGFARSRLGRRFARWEQTAEALRADPRTRASIETRPSFGPIELEKLEVLPPGTLGRVFAEHCRTLELDPNLIHVPPSDEIGWLLNHLYQTHDIWHVVSGWGNDLPGEVGLGGFYCAQFGAPAFFGYMISIILLNAIFRRAPLGPIIEALGAGYRAGQRAEPLIAVDWRELWEVPVSELRLRFRLEPAEIVGEGIPAAA